jgi:predicted amidohydrolase YtcJ
MNRMLLIAAAVATVVLATCGPAAASVKPADTLFTHGYIYTVDRHHSVAQAVAVRDGKIVFVGSNAKGKAFRGSRTKVVNLGGKMVLPSFTDAHMHATGGALQELYAISFTNFYDPTIQEYLDIIAAFAKSHPDMVGYSGSGWLNGTAPGIGPLATDLDKVVSDKPVVLNSQDGHSVWVNSKALQMAGITKDTPDPANGKIERLPDGTPSGTLRESAESLVADVIPDYSLAEYEAAILHFQKDTAAPLGLTQAFLAVMRPKSTECAAYEDLAKRGKLTMRVRGALYIVPGAAVAPQIKAAVAERAKHKTPDFQTKSVKFLVDGVIEGHTGYLLKPYADAKAYNGDASYRGMSMWTQKALSAASAAAAKAGFRLHYHAIGDAAVRMALNAIQAAEKATGKKDMRPAITHLQLVSAKDMKRFKTLRVVAVPQPYWAVSDEYYHDIQLPYLGKWRADHEYPMESFFKEGVLVASGSDYPVTVPDDTLAGIETGVLRWYQGISYGNEVLWPEECCSIRQMIDSFTINGSKSLFTEKISGSIAVGKSADMVVLSKNIFRISPKSIGDSTVSHVLATYFHGLRTYQAK